MRKTWIIAIAAAAVVLAGCNREFDAPVAGDGLLRAAIETPTRVAFSDEGVFSWQASDAIAVSTNAGFKTFTLQSGAGSGTGAFQGDLSGVTSATVAIYPASIAKDDATVTLPAEYAWAEGQSNAAMFCSQVSLTEVNSFKHLGGILKITYAEIPADADALVLKAEAKITGDFAISDGKIAAGVGSDQVKVTFTAGSNPAAFYIPVPTGEYKFSVELQKAGAAIEGTSISTTNAIKVDRKSLILMDPIAGVQAGATIKDFAEEYVKILDIWQSTTGTIDMLKGEAYEGGEWNVADAHYVPSTTKITVGGKEYTTGDMFETALRSYLLIRGYNGLDAVNYGKDKIAALEGGAVAMSATEVPETHGYYFGTSPFNETPGNGGHLVLGTADVNEHCKVKTDILDNWAMRSLNFQKGQPITNLCGYAGGQLAGYYGCFCSQRALITYAFFFKYMLDNSLDKGTDVAADVIIRSELFGDEGPAEPELPMEIATADDFLAFVENAKKYAATDEVKLTADITLPETFVPDTLWCNFDGQGHKVTYNLASDVSMAEVPSAANIGLFRIVNGTVKNLKAAGSLTCSAPAGSGTYHIGGIAGLSAENAVFENCESDVHILATTKLTHHMGGIVGFSSTGTSFKDCRNTGAVEMILEGTANASQIAGIVGHLDHSATFENCVNDGELKYVGNGTARIAGMAGYLYGPKTISFKDCVNNGAVTSVGFKASQYTYVGGISAYFQENAADPTTVEYIRCTNNGKITCNIGTGGDTAQNRAGGIAGHAGKSAEITFQDCVNNGEVTTDGTGSKTVIGGIIGFAESSGNVTCDGCENAAAIRAASAAGGIVGGLVGQTQSASSTFTNFSIAYGSDVEIKSGTVGAAIGKAAALTTAMTGKVTAVTVTKGETATVLTAENYQDFVLGDPTLGEGGSKEGVLFDGTPMMFSGGDGTEAKPYKIKTAADLVALAEKVNNEATYADFADKYYVQISDIEMRDVATSPIGKTTALAFKGRYDGRGNEIANLFVDGESSDNPASGLFGYADGATFKDIVLRNRTNAGTYGYVAGLVGRADNCTITGCSVRDGVLKAGNSYAGGITAYLNGGSVTSCTVFALKIESAYNHVGGLVGEFFDGSMSACTLDGGAIITGKQNIGGLAGWFDKGEMKDCLVAGSSRITASGDGVGGLVGRGIAKNGGTCLIDGCLVEASFVEGAFSVGGLMGYAYPDPNGSMLFYNSGMVGTDLVATACDTGGDPAKGDSMIAGICGWMRASDKASSAKIINCFAHFRPGGFVLRLAMVNASAGGVFGYTSLSAAGTIEIANFVTNLGENHLYVGGSAVTSSVKRYGAFYGMLPDKAITIRKSFCVTGLPMYGETGASVVQEDNVALEPGALGTCVDKLSAFAASFTDYPLKGWELSSGGLPVVK